MKRLWNFFLIALIIISIVFIPKIYDPKINELKDNGIVKLVTSGYFYSIYEVDGKLFKSYGILKTGDYCTSDEQCKTLAKDGVSYQAMARSICYSGDCGEWI